MTSKLFRAEVIVSYGNGVRFYFPHSTVRLAYRELFRMIRKDRSIESAELVVGSTKKLKMHAREYSGGRYMVLSRCDGSTVSAWVLNGNREGRDKGDY